MTRKQMLSDIDKVQTAINDFVHDGDDYMLLMNDDDFRIEGQAIRDMQRRLARINIDLSNLYRRIDDKMQLL